MSDWYSELPRAGERYPSKKRKRRSARAWATRIVVVVGFVAFMFGVYSAVDRGRDWLQAKASETTATTVATTVKVVISPGMTASQIGELLEDKGVVSSAAAFVDLVASRGSEEKLKPGTYQLPTKANS
jgi:cell division protein YceG involved in septum cleavage